MEKEDVDFLNKNCKATKDNKDYDPLCLHIFWKNKEVSEQNQIATDMLVANGTVIEEIVAKDSIIDDTFLNEGSKINILRSLMEKSHIESGQLHYKLNLGINFRVSLTTNVCVKDGLVNGSMGVIRLFTKTSSGSLHIIWIEFDDKSVGNEIRRYFKGLYQRLPDINTTWTPIMAVSKQFNSGLRGNKKFISIKRIQFPVETAFARTLTKVQGMSIDYKHYIDFLDLRNHGKSLSKSSHRTPNAHVVGLSRATDPSHLKILNGFDERLMARCRIADNEIDRLRNDPDAQLKLKVPDLRKMQGTNIVYFNLQGLRSKERIDKISKHRNLMEANIILGSETNITSETPLDHYTIPGFFSQKFVGPSKKIGRGLILYTKQQISDDSIFSEMKDDAEYVCYREVINEKKIAIVFLYRSAQYPISKFKSDINEIVKEVSQDDNVLILGDMNTDEIIITAPGYEQQIQCPTTSGMHGKTIDQAYTRLKDFTATGHVLYKSFSKSYHHPICINLLLKK